MSGVTQRLTSKQAKILTHVEAEIARAGRPPTYRDMAAKFGTAVSTIEDHIRALIKKGYLEKEAGVSCGLRIPHHTPSASIPILGSVPAGRPLEAVEDALGFIPVAWRFRGEIYALKVKGESMRDAGILEGDLIVVRQQNDADHGDIVVALIDGEATVKYLEKRHGRLRLLPANPHFHPIELEPGRANLIQGKVVSVQRYY